MNIERKGTVYLYVEFRYPFSGLTSQNLPLYVNKCLWHLYALYVCTKCLLIMVDMSASHVTLDSRFSPSVQPTNGDTGRL